MRQVRHPERDEITFIAVVAAFSDPIRVGLLRVLADGRERQWGELRAPVAKSTLSHHLRVLRDAGVTRTRQEGTRCYVELRREDLDARFPGLVDAVLHGAEGDDVGADVGVVDNASTSRPAG
ncbi:ArsR/SmtB family transcription factor [Myceligenerans indicum]|uniref:Helix-turn-helix transcriptional regulator n=1 Tax=Myceligenerans indicum TaxID=2593663 RepID=A0ABS1LR13_9MICO|nr:helix-turn-helix domain-containing protein [Myceligenerans indicum]MBL0887957.1 helix-turn-helix transcriptional regulator [Myceligenerans indicum]